MDEAVKRGDLWRHYKGGCYCVQGMARIEATGEYAVLYCAEDADERAPPWVRPLAEWREAVPGHGQRFTLIARAAIAKATGA